MNVEGSYDSNEESSINMNVSSKERSKADCSSDSLEPPLKKSARFINANANIDRMLVKDAEKNSQDSGYGNEPEERAIEEFHSIKFLEHARTAPRSIFDTCENHLDNLDVDLLRSDSIDENITLSETPENSSYTVVNNGISFRTYRENYNSQIFKYSTNRLTSPIHSSVRTTLFKTKFHSTSEKSFTNNENFSIFAPLKSVQNLSQTLAASQFGKSMFSKRSNLLSENNSSGFNEGYKCHKISNLDLTDADESDSAADTFKIQRTISAETSVHIDSTEFQTNPSSDKESIMRAVERSIETENLVGDFGKCFILPLVEGRHRDMKYISAKTLASLIKGDFAERVVSYKIIDCRYPYEYEGGHISGAVNYYTKDIIDKEMIESKHGISSGSTHNLCENQDNSKHDIIIFHCEFSTQRGPKLCRCLRQLDRSWNSNVYPALYYPEMYLLHGGYKEFYQSYGELCIPDGYVTMDDPAYQLQFSYFRATARSAEKNCKKKF